MLNVLVLCEYSGRVRDAFIKQGHNAISCDLLPTESPGPHYQGDAFDMLNKKWDIIIAHPPCTAIAVSGNSTYGVGKPQHIMRLRSLVWTRRLWDKCCIASDNVCFENPVGILQRMARFPKPQYVHPYHFGHMEQKKTGLFLHGLPPLTPTDNVYSEMMKLPIAERQRLYRLPPSHDRWKIRSTTFYGLATAMAKQWG